MATSTTLAPVQIFAEAHAAGVAAAGQVTPTPVLWGSPSTPFGSDVDLSQPHEVSTAGVCGFAWVRFPGTTAFARWAKSAGHARKDHYHGGYCISARVGGQSLEIKEAYAEAFAEVLRGHGIAKVYVDSRMD